MFETPFMGGTRFSLRRLSLTGADRRNVQSDPRALVNRLRPAGQ